jgi:hypothetical protein
MLPENGVYEKSTLCLDPLYAGRPTRVQLYHYGGTGACAVVTAQRAILDDIEVTTDPACPVQ